MSLSLIIMLIIGLVILALIIGFVTNFLGQATGEFEITARDQQIFDRLKNEGAVFALGSHDYTLKIGSEEKIHAVIRNVGGSAITLPTTLSSSSTHLKVSVQDRAGNSNDYFEFYSQPLPIGEGETEAFLISMEAGNSLTPGVYYATFTLTLGISDERTVVITINAE